MKYLYGTAVMAACLVSAYAEEEKAPMAAIAMELLARASSTSEVLTLNLTNLLILLVLKALIFGFGLFSFGNTGRSADVGPTVSQSDLTGGMCFMMFTAGDLDKITCVQRSACEDPKNAQDYLTAAKMWHKLNSLMKIVPFNREYYDIMTAVQGAVDHSVKGGDCKVYPW